MVAIYEGGSGNPADVDDCDAYADVIGAKRKYPVFADGGGKIMGATPLDQTTHPQICALTDELEILSCYDGHGSYETALDDIRAHAGI